MKLSFRQTKSDITFGYEAELDGDLIAKTKVSGAIGLEVKTIFLDQCEYTIISKAKVDLKELSLSFKTFLDKERLIKTYFINRDNQEIGSILVLSKRTSLFSGYEFYKMIVGHDVIDMYDIGLGKRGRYICVYHQNKQIGVVEKRIEVEDNLDSYMIYLEDGVFYREIISFLGLFDMINSSNRGHHDIKVKDYNYYYSTSKELLGRFNLDYLKKLK